MTIFWSCMIPGRLDQFQETTVMIFVSWCYWLCNSIMTVLPQIKKIHTSIIGPFCDEPNCPPKPDFPWLLLLQGLAWVFLASHPCLLPRSGPLHHPVHQTSLATHAYTTINLRILPGPATTQCPKHTTSNCPTQPNITPTLQAWTTVYFLYTNSVPYVHLTSFHPSYFQPLGPTHPHIFSTVSTWSVHTRLRILKGSLHAQISLQKLPTIWKDQASIFSPRPIRSVEMFDIGFPRWTPEHRI